MEEEKYTVPAATITEKPDEYDLRIEIPGIAKENAELHIEGRTLTLKTRAKFQKPAGFRQIAAEFEHTNYAISVDLPEMADPKAMTAKLENGILDIAIKKRAESQPRKIEIV